MQMRETPQFCLGQLRDEAFSEEAWLVLLSSPLSHSFWRGSNAPLIYHSSRLSVWSSSDDPHLAPAVFSYPLPTHPGLWCGFTLPRSVSASVSSLFGSARLHAVSVSLCLKADFLSRNVHTSTLLSKMMQMCLCCQQQDFWTWSFSSIVLVFIQPLWHISLFSVLSFTQRGSGVPFLFI